MLNDMVKIGLDPGHGGRDVGAHRDWAPYTEADFNLALCRELNGFLKTIPWPVEPVFLRWREDEMLTLEERGERSADTGCKLVLSIHVNAADNSAIDGGMLFHWPSNMVGESVGNAIAKAFPEPLYRQKPHSIAATDMPTSSDDWLQRPREVLKPHRCTAVLVETGFISNRRDSEQLALPSVRRGLVAACVTGIAEFMRLTY